MTITPPLYKALHLACHHHHHHPAPLVNHEGTLYSFPAFSINAYGLSELQLDLTDDQLAAHSAASWRGLLEGTAFGTAVATAGSLFSHRRFPGYQALPNSLKALGAIIVIAPAAAIQAERRGLEYDRTQWYA